MNNDIFRPADILLFNGPDKTAFSVVACDQYTSEPEYWERVAQRVGDRPSALKMIFPEAFLKSRDFDRTIDSINRTMADYLSQGLFRECPGSFLYIERRQRNGKIRRGLIGMVDLEAYDYSVGSQSPIRATEGTVLERIPPRVKIRENAPLELPHVMLLIDDRKKAVIEPLAARKQSFEQAYSFDLMENSGHLEGYLLPAEECRRILSELAQGSDRESFEKTYGVQGMNKGVLPFAVGDGNHSLATARKCYLNLKEKLGEAALHHPARYALTELVNLHDDSLEFEAIHRIVTGVSPDDLLEAFGRHFDLSESGGGQRVSVVRNGAVRELFITNPSKNLAVGSLQEFLDQYTAEKGGEIDYIHGEDVVKSLSAQKDSIGFLLPSMDKNDLFQTVILDGALPRKTFSMGEACDKRFYFEARKIC